MGDMVGRSLSIKATEWEMDRKDVEGWRKLVARGEKGKTK